MPIKLYSIFKYQLALIISIFFKFTHQYDFFCKFNLVMCVCDLNSIPYDKAKFEISIRLSLQPYQYHFWVHKGRWLAAKMPWSCRPFVRLAITRTERITVKNKANLPNLVQERDLHLHLVFNDFSFNMLTLFRLILHSQKNESKGIQQKQEELKYFWSSTAFSFIHDLVIFSSNKPQAFSI